MLRLKTKIAIIWGILIGNYNNFLMINIIKGKEIYSNDRADAMEVGEKIELDLIQFGVNERVASNVIKHLLSISPQPFNHDLANITLTAVPSKRGQDKGDYPDYQNLSGVKTASEEIESIYRNSQGESVTLQDLVDETAVKFDNSHAGMEEANEYHKYREECSSGHNKHLSFTDPKWKEHHEILKTANKLWNATAYLTLFDFYRDICSAIGVRALPVQNRGWEDHYNQILMKK